MYFIAFPAYLLRENTRKIQEEMRILEIRLGRNQGQRTEYTPFNYGIRTQSLHCYAFSNIHDKFVHAPDCKGTEINDTPTENTGASPCTGVY